MQPIIIENMVEINTAPAAISFILLMDSWCEADIKSQIPSIVELIISKLKTREIQSSISIHSVLLI